MSGKTKSTAGAKAPAQTAPSTLAGATETTGDTDVGTTTSAQTSEQGQESHVLAPTAPTATPASLDVAAQAAGDVGASDTSLVEGHGKAAPGASGSKSPDPDQVKTYVVGVVPIRHNGRVYGVGFDIRLTDVEATRLSGLVTPIPQE